MENEKLFTTDRNRIPQAWNSISGIPNSSFYPNSENPIDLFESALSSMVSSPVNSHTGIPIPGGDDGIVLRELIGRLGSICNSSEISPQSCCNNGSNSESNSCHNTPLNSPPKLNLSITDHQIHGSYSVQGNCQFPSRFSTGKNEFPDVMESRVSFKTAGSQFMRIPEENKNCSEGSLVFETNGRKRKGSFKGKGKETQSGTCTCTTISAKDDKGVAEVEKDESDAKRSKSNEKSTEPVKDYIHVRARRGQATDSHSLAERVRREKISERMKFLQDLVPGCNKVTGKAVMLDEIINYVQSLQRQVEFLSMKLATVDPSMDVSMEALVSKDIFRPRVSVTNNVNPLVQPFSYGLQTQMNCMVPSGLDNQFTMNPMMVAMQCNSIMKPSHIHGFGEVSTFSENDLQSVVKMAIDQDQLQGFLGQMKVEL